MDFHCKHAIWFKFNDLHCSFNRSSTAFVTPVDNRSNANGSVGVQPEFDIRVPAGMISDVVYGVKVKYFINWSINYF